jgi:hypothetical protein
MLCCKSFLLYLLLVLLAVSKQSHGYEVIDVTYFGAKGDGITGEN